MKTNIVIAIKNKILKKQKNRKKKKIEKIKY